MVLNAVKDLTAYGISRHLIEPEDAVYAGNQLLDVMKLEPPADFTIEGGNGSRPLEEILKELLDDAVARGIIEDGIATRDLFDTRLMGVLTPRPSQVISKFRQYDQESPEKATDYFYQLSCDSDYVRTYRIAKDRRWKTATPYGDFDITINLSKPEKDPRAIAAALKKKQEMYPKCLLCRQNEGYAGRLDHPARQTIRLIPLTLDGARYYMQYSPYSYYHEHCIVLSEKHEPMHIDRHAFASLLDFVGQFPHYMIGSNADIPIVGGSILTHEHFQGGKYEFAMAKAPIREKFVMPAYKDIEAGIVKWPMSVIRLDGEDPKRLCECADHILQTWIHYSDEEAGFHAFDGDVRHNTVTPIARRKGNAYELDLVLRNNCTSEKYPLGIFHPHPEYHHIKRENIGLIEVMGLAVLPSRLLKDMELMKETEMKGEDVMKVPALEAHAPWLKEVEARHPEIVGSTDENLVNNVLQQEVGTVFLHVLEDCGVFKDTETGRTQFARFLQALGA